MIHKNYMGAWPTLEKCLRRVVLGVLTDLIALTAPKEVPKVVGYEQCTEGPKERDCREKTPRKGCKRCDLEKSSIACLKSGHMPH